MAYVQLALGDLRASAETFERAAAAAAAAAGLSGAIGFPGMSGSGLSGVEGFAGAEGLAGVAVAAVPGGPLASEAAAGGDLNLTGSPSNVGSAAETRAAQLEGLVRRNRGSSSLLRRTTRVRSRVGTSLIPQPEFGLYGPVVGCTATQRKRRSQHLVEAKSGLCRCMGSRHTPRDMLCWTLSRVH